MDEPHRHAATEFVGREVGRVRPAPHASRDWRGYYRRRKLPKMVVPVALRLARRRLRTSDPFLTRANGMPVANRRHSGLPVRATTG